jgi:transposase-like protein
MKKTKISCPKCGCNTWVHSKKHSKNPRRKCPHCKFTFSKNPREENISLPARNIIRALYVMGFSIDKIAIKYGVSKSYIAKLVKGLNEHIERPAGSKYLKSPFAEFVSEEKPYEINHKEVANRLFFYFDLMGSERGTLLTGNETIMKRIDSI